MDGWAQALRTELDNQEKGLASAVGLKQGISGEEFETALGELFRWRDLRELNSRFRALGSIRLGSPSQSAIEVERQEQRRLKEIMSAMNTTLFRLFGASAIDEAKAVDAYGWLLEVLGRPRDLVMVTTNYDPAIELALYGIGLRAETGFDRVPGRAPRFKPEGMVESLRGVAGSVPVLHLHGAVGWYEKRGKGREHEQHLPFQRSNGRPMVLYPDPEKDPTRDAFVQSLWDEFDLALRDATHVIVVGHSLHDQVLVSRLRDAAKHASVAICLLGHVNRDRKMTALKGAKKRIQDLLPEASAHPPVVFGPREMAHLTYLGSWISRTRDVE
jgi:hypothetical protein